MSPSGCTVVSGVDIVVSICNCSQIRNSTCLIFGVSTACLEMHKRKFWYQEFLFQNCNSHLGQWPLSRIWEFPFGMWPWSLVMTFGTLTTWITLLTFVILNTATALVPELRNNLSQAGVLGTTLMPGLPYADGVWLKCDETTEESWRFRTLVCNRTVDGNYLQSSCQNIRSMHHVACYAHT